MGKDTILKSIINEAAVDTYSEDEELEGWEAIFVNNIATPQRCKIKTERGTLIKIYRGVGSVNARVRFDKLEKQVNVPIEDISLEDKDQNKYIKAYIKRYF